MEDFDNDENEKNIEFEKEKKTLITKFVVTIIIVAIISAVIASEFTLFYYYKQNNVEKYESSQNSDENIDIIAKTLKEFRKTIDEYYINSKEIDEQKILDETIKGYVNGLDDEYSEYMTRKEWNDFQADALGNYIGIGVYITVDANGNVIIVNTIKGTPAEKVGLQSGDVIVSIDDENVLGMNPDMVSSKIQGKEEDKGKKVKITISRGTEYLDFEIKRDEIKVYHVETKMLENDIGYISLMTFDEGCSNEFKAGYEKLKSEGAKKIILDLRNNTGGIVDEALLIADMILPKDNKILITVDSKGNKEESISKEDPIINEDIVVLVNEYSASASEIVVGALKDNNKAKIVGKKTYGKGVIQSVFMLEDGSALKLTVNEYFTPNETKINKVGIMPDYEVDLDTNTEDDEQLNKAIEILK